MRKVGKTLRLTVDKRAYSRYIASPEWAAKRQQALKAHGTFCRGCGRNKVTLHVHHRTYERLGAEDMADLVTLCDSCHNGVHQLVASGVPLTDATDKAVASRPAEDNRTTVDFVPLNRRPGYKSPDLGGRGGQLFGLPIVVTSKRAPSPRRSSPVTD